MVVQLQFLKGEEMKKYRVKEDIYSNVWGGKNGQELKFKKGDIVESDEVDNGGIYAPPTHNAGRGVAMDMAFIPLSKLTQLSGTPNEPSNMFPVTNDDNTKLLQYALIGLIIYVVFIK